MAKKIDKILLDELIALTENNAYLYEILVTTYLDNLKKKKIKGIYDKKKAIKLLEYYYSNYVRPYFKKKTNYGFDFKLSPEGRKLFAKYFSDYLYSEFLKGIKIPKKNKSSKK